MVTSHPTVKAPFVPQNLTHMGRPTVEPKKKNIKVRVSEEIYTELEKRGNVSETLRNLIKNNLLGFVPQKENAYKDLECMLRCWHTDIDGLLEMFQNQMDEGSIYLENGRIKGECEVDIDRFLEACEEKMVDPQEMIEKATEMVWNG